MPSEVLVLERESAVAQDDYAWLIFLSEAAVEESAVTVPNIALPYLHARDHNFCAELNMS